MPCIGLTFLASIHTPTPLSTVDVRVAVVQAQRAAKRQAQKDALARRKREEEERERARAEQEEAARRQQGGGAGAAAQQPEIKFCRPKDVRAIFDEWFSASPNHTQPLQHWFFLAGHEYTYIHNKHVGKLAAGKKSWERYRFKHFLAIALEVCAVGRHARRWRGPGIPCLHSLPALPFQHPLAPSRPASTRSCSWTRRTRRTRSPSSRPSSPSAAWGPSARWVLGRRSSPSPSTTWTP